MKRRRDFIGRSYSFDFECLLEGHGEKLVLWQCLEVVEPERCVDGGSLVIAAAAVP